MNESLIKEQVIEAIDEIRRPAPHLLASSMARVRAQTSPRTAPRFAAYVAVFIAVAVVTVLVGVPALRHAMAPHTASPVPGVDAACSLPVRTDQGPGILEFPTAVFHPAGLPAATATAYNPATHKWLPTEPQGISADRQRVALLDTAAGHNLAFQLETADGKLLYSRQNVISILGWSSANAVLVTALDPAGRARLLQISGDGRQTKWIDPLSNATTTWSFVAGHYVWGVALPYPDPDQHREVVRLDLATGAVIDWYAMMPGSFNDSGGGPILGLTPDGYPIIPQLKSDSQSAVYVLRAKDTPTVVEVTSGDEIATSMFWPLQAIGGATGIWVTTSDGELYRSTGRAGLQLVAVANTLHIYSFGGSCA
ncbi:MAG TPA: hypothetical protein VGG90_00940 [Candidatus Dormibacteraeota bacterium]